MDAIPAEVHDVVGIGFGPSNLSLAVALEELGQGSADQSVSAVFFERQETFGWHRNMLLPSATMQISFLKDLATFRNPTSKYSFVSYLHSAGRLARFVNNQDFFPTRKEFHQYLEWVASNFRERVNFGHEVVAVRPAAGAVGPMDHLEVEVRRLSDGSVRVIRARNVVLSTGLAARMPDGIDRSERVWHSSEFLTKFRSVDPDSLKSVAVVGAGQSAAEITRYFHDSLPHAQVYSVLPSYGYALADDTPFANQVFDPTAVDDYYFGTDTTRQAFWDYHKNTNYSVVDDDVIRDLYRRTYEEDVHGTSRLHFLNLTRVSAVEAEADRTRVTLTHGDLKELDVDVCVFATGYDAMDPARLLGDFDRQFLRDARGAHQVTRDYRLVAATENAPGRVYLQGGTEHTHGLTSSLLSNLAVRSGEIADSILGFRLIEKELELPAAEAEVVATGG
ncbi:lysine N(6)-hydroxylase/L-ornithine N(5)-oxygenase family protein [Streptomyces sp. NBC_00859]|uniref:lysine N(6)-hydroxylase/L-ornithine N(5)-oxygenase family protein n=1 Tax=Streptomyces sp. NBC_00859 TaxID=2903682 RepID=UPI0038648A3D|nr:lysine N(6)-hydroxylase/L-ornithine N(5)-oxygenase family protein [Streptomyces sp. NBC_00859]